MRYDGAMRVLFALFLLCPPVFAAESEKPFLLSPTLWDRVDPARHTEDRPFGSYLVMNLNFDAAKALYQQIDGRLGGTLDKKKARTEAHITVITPVEYDRVLKPVLDIEEIHAIAGERRIQRAGFEAICMGRARSADAKRETYFLVVESRELREIRREVFRRFRLNGGDPSRFDPELWYPHVTIGYTGGDLHLERDGVMKGRNACWRPLRILSKPK
jgi:hypothetical protein